ncbi:PRC-barrel domain-containing protein [Arcticibacter tournemirensis]
MIRSIQSLINNRIAATDGEVGKVKDMYFDDQTWRLRYLVVETGNWLFGRKVLISPVALGEPDWDAGFFPANLTTDQVKNSPDVNSEKPVSRQEEADLHNHYSWPGFGGGGAGFVTTGMVGAVIDPTVPLDEAVYQDNKSADPHLRSFSQLQGYDVYFTGEHPVGEVADLLIDTSSWRIIAMQIGKGGNGEESGNYFVSTSVVKKIEYETSSLFIDPNEELKQSVDEISPVIE